MSRNSSPRLLAVAPSQSSRPRRLRREWVRIVNGINPMTKYQSVCTPGYYNGEGTSEGGFLQAVYPKGALAFFDLLTRWREQGDLAGLIVN